MKIYNNHILAPIPIESQNELISVIVTVYNIEKYVERGVNSIINQTYKNLEIILVDDGSTDSGAGICDELAERDDRIVVIHKKNGGPADARNAGMAVAKGNLIGFVDGDDWIDEDMYEKMYSAVLEQDADMAVCRYRQVYKDLTQDDSVDRVILFEGQEALQYYVEEREEYNIQNAVWNKLFRRELLKGINFPVERWCGEDIVFTTEALSRVKRCVYLDSACYNYIIDREGSIMNTRIISLTFKDLIPIYREKTKFLIKIERQDLADVHDYFFYKRMLLFYNQLKKSDLPDKNKYLNKITKVINEEVLRNQGRYDRIYECSIANPNEKRKMDLFIKSPNLYWCIMIINEKFILPVKMKLKKQT